MLFTIGPGGGDDCYALSQLNTVSKIANELVLSIASLRTFSKEEEVIYDGLYYFTRHLLRSSRSSGAS